MDEQAEELLKRLSQEFQSTLEKMPKDKIQMMYWANEWVDEQVEELQKSGLDIYQILGVVKSLEEKLLKIHLQNEETAKKVGELAKKVEAQNGNENRQDQGNRNPADKDQADKQADEHK